MSAYAVFTYTITDPEGYENYVPGVLPLLEKHGAEILAADYDAQNLEGEQHAVTVILRFASEEAARAWYDDADYAPVKQIRFGAAKIGTGVIAKEFTPPPATP